jgi:hypothetical protein
LVFGADDSVSLGVPCNLPNSSVSSLENNRNNFAFSSKLLAANLAIADGSGVVSSGLCSSGSGALPIGVVEPTEIEPHFSPRVKPTAS